MVCKTGVILFGFQCLDWYENLRPLRSYIGLQTIYQSGVSVPNTQNNHLTTHDGRSQTVYVISLDTNEAVHYDVIKWKHSALLALCAGNSPVTGEFPTQRPVTRSFDVFFDMRVNTRLSKQSWGWCFAPPVSSLWCHCNGVLNITCVCVSIAIVCPLDIFGVRCLQIYKL